MKLFVTSPSIILLCIGLTACQNTQYQRQPISIPEQWQNQSSVSSTDNVSSFVWWQQFNEPALLELLQAVRRSNSDLSLALIKVHQAQLSSNLGDNNGRPGINFSLNNNKQRKLNKGSNWLTIESSSINLNTSYEVDIWRRVDASLRAQTQQYLASQYDQAAAVILSDSTAASLYWKIGQLKAQITLVQNDLKDLQKIQSLVKTRLQAGAISTQEIIQASQAVLNQQNRLRDLQSNLQQQNNVLALLLDQAPGTDPLPYIPTLTANPILPIVDAGLPSTLLARRPDLMAEEARLKATLANIDELKASFMPKISLTGQLGTSSNSLNNLLQNPIATLGAGIVLPFLQWKQQDLQLKAKQADYEAAVIRFRQTLYNAFREVNDALNTRDRLEHNTQNQIAAFTLSQQNENITKSRYLAGTVDLQTWLNAIQNRRQIESNLLELRLSQLKNLVDIYKALGGPFE